MPVFDSDEPALAKRLLPVATYTTSAARNDGGRAARRVVADHVARANRRTVRRAQALDHPRPSSRDARGDAPGHTRTADNAHKFQATAAHAERQAGGINGAWTIASRSSC
jgi:hypothetical protein